MQKVPEHQVFSIIQIHSFNPELCGTENLCRCCKEVSIQLIIGKQASMVQGKLQCHSSHGLSLPPYQN